MLKMINSYKKIDCDTDAWFTEFKQRDYITVFGERKKCAWANGERHTTEQRALLDSETSKPSL